MATNTIVKSDFQNRLAGVALAAMVAIPGAAQAANDPPTPISDPNAIIETAAPETPTYGSSRTFLTLGAWGAQPIDSSVTFAFDNFPGGQGLNRTGGSPFFKLPVFLPNGAIVSELELTYCDTGALFDIAAHWFRQPKNGDVVAQTDVVVSAGTPGCVSTTGAITETIDNDANSYNIEIFMGATDATIVFLSARVGYRLQVSPAPATATFGDVPVGDPIHRFVEALAAAGITGGCGGGNFCPDSPLTRGQMAVFLSAALGLHWPN